MSRKLEFFGIKVVQNRLMPAKSMSEHRLGNSQQANVYKCEMVNDTTGVLQKCSLNLRRAPDI